MKLTMMIEVRTSTQVRAIWENNPCKYYLNNAETDFLLWML